MTGLLRRLLPWVLCIGVGSLAAPTIAGEAIFIVADVRSTSFHWRLETNLGPSQEGWVIPDAVHVTPYADQPPDPRAWRRIGLPRLLGLDRRPDGLVWHIEGEGLLNAGDAWIGLDGHPRLVQLRETNLYPKGTPGLIVSTYTYDGYDRRPPPSRAEPPPDRAAGDR